MHIPLTRKSESIYILVLGFGFLIFLLSLFAYSSNQQINTSYTAIKGSSIASDKMEVIVRLIETARARSRLTMQMSYETDPFKKMKLISAWMVLPVSFISIEKNSSVWG